MGVGPRPRLARFLPVHYGSGGRTWSQGPWWAPVLLNALVLVVVVEAVDVALDWECGRCWSAGGRGGGCCSWVCGLAGRPMGLADEGVLVNPPPSRSRRFRSRSGRCSGRRPGPLRCAASCELRAAAPRCSGLVAPSGTREMGNLAAVKRF